MMTKVYRLMAVILAFLAVGSIYSSAQTNKTVYCGQLSATVPDSWTTSASDIAGVGKTLILANKENNPAYVCTFYEYSLYLENLHDGMATYVKNNQNMFFKGAEFGPINPTTVGGQDALKMDYSNYFMDATHLCRAYCVNSGDKTYILVFMRKQGNADIFDNVVRTIKFHNDDTTRNPAGAKNEQPTDVRAELRQLHNSLFPNGGQGRKIDDGIMLNNLDVSDTEDVVIYAYGILSMNVSTMTQADKDAFAESLRVGLLEETENNRRNFKALDRAIKEGYSVRIAVEDKNRRTICILNYPNKAFKQ